MKQPKMNMVKIYQQHSELGAIFFMKIILRSSIVRIRII